MLAEPRLLRPSEVATEHELHGLFDNLLFDIPERVEKKALPPKNPCLWGAPDYPTVSSMTNESQTRPSVRGTKESSRDKEIAEIEDMFATRVAELLWRQHFELRQTRDKPSVPTEESK